MSSTFMLLRRLRIRGFPERTCLTLSESGCLPFDPEIPSDRRSGTPMCQNSTPTHTHTSPPSHKHQPQPLPRNPPGGCQDRRRFLREGAKRNKTHSEQHERRGMGWRTGRKLVMCYKKNNIYLLLRTCRSMLRTKGKKGRIVRMYSG